MATKKQRKVHTFWERSLIGSRLKDSLTEMGVGPEFLDGLEKTYKSKHQRTGRVAQPLTQEQIAACKQFDKDGDMDRLKTALDVKTVQGAASVFARYRIQLRHPIQ